MGEQDTAGSGDATPNDRGRLSLAPVAVARLVTRASMEVDGVARVGSALDRVASRSYPHANVTLAGSRARVSVEIAVTWPNPLADVAARVRDRVRERLQDLAGVQLDVVDVTVAKVVRATAPVRRVQ